MTSRNRRVSLLGGVAAGALALTAVAGIPAAGAAPGGTAAAAAAPQGKTFKVRNEKQLRRAVFMSNKTTSRDRIWLLDSITFDAGETRGGAFRGDLDVRGPLRVVGNGHSIDADGVDRVFDVRSGGALTLKRITLTGGSARPGDSGGAIRNQGVTKLHKTKVTDSEVTGPEASGGAIMNEGGRVVVAGSRLAGNSANRAGGAIEALEGTTIVRGSRLLRNATGVEPGNGGALHLTGAGTVVVRNSWVVGNTATAEGGGLWNSADGTFRVIDTRLFNNTAGGAGADQGGGALYNDGGDLTVTGSRLAENSATGASGSGGGILNNLGTLLVEDSMITGNRTPRAGGGIEAVAGDTTVVGSWLSSNRAIGAPGNGGAIHLTGPGNVEVRETTVRNNVATAEGGGLWNSADGTFSVVDTQLVGNVARGPAADQGGGGLYNDGGTLTVTGSTLEANDAMGEAGSGGGILNNLGTLEVTDSTLVANRASRAGGGIEANVGTTTVSGTTFDANSTGAAPGNGGGFHLTGAGTVEVTDSTVTDNTAAAEGGGLWNSATGTFTVTDTEFSGNTAAGAAADQGGGALFNDGGALTVSGSTFTGNTATGAAGSGGGILNNLGTLTISGSTLSGNTAVRAGGGVETNVGTVTITEVDMTDNSTGAAPGNGGALHLTGASMVTWTGGTVTGNDAANEGGGLWNSATGTLTATVDISGNTAPTGPDAYNDGGVFILNGSPVLP